MAGARSDEYESDSFSEESSEDKSSKDSNAKYDHQKSSHKSSNMCLDFERIKTFFRVDLMYKEKIEEWPTTTDLYFTLDFINQTKYSKGYKSEKDIKKGLFSNCKKQNKQGVKLHAEDMLLAFLSEEVMSKMLSDVSTSSDTSARSKKYKKMKMKLEILINYSPCKCCAYKIKAFKEDIEKHIESDIRLTFGTFYKVYPKTDKNKHIKGLAKLHNAGIKLQLVWDYKLMEEIIQEIGSEEDRDKREKKDREYMELVIKKAETIAD